MRIHQKLQKQRINEKTLYSTNQVIVPQTDTQFHNQLSELHKVDSLSLYNHTCIHLIHDPYCPSIFSQTKQGVTQSLVNPRTAFKLSNTFKLFTRQPHTSSKIIPFTTN